MGGTIAIAIRDPQGNEWRMQNATSSMLHDIRNAAIYRKDLDHLRKITNDWEEMTKDWNKNKKTGKYKLPVTEFYAPFPSLLAPMQYGLVVVDMKNEIILDAQSFSELYSFNASIVSSSLIFWSKGERQIDDDQWETFQEFWNQKKFSGIVSLANGEKIKESDHLLSLSLDKLAEYFLANEEKQRWTQYAFKIETAPFKCRHFDESSPIELRNMKKAIRNELRFALSKEEIAAWTEYITAVAS